ncbi:sugar ABC transporter ATP-binding protein [Pseudarthrobacter oxydans]|jgi:putative multiple sugar transport system ATP-binding protein|uniref:Multiple sugar transport system ATP-binding protein n=1 Tax=Pseudarthrobacter oxydans TaxID=1671 RepID=A0AAW8N4P4_PSEOX|nr:MULTISPECIES: multiple monosaccharide ABC transporter ATP-binding protein [Pseudarthrobacter]MBA4102622.1 ABC transporter ATP-binding protein [Arthrobacter sp.]MDV2977748.1 sugar ABC transporter ATP-binding protein [Actinomycetes bacterium ARC8]WHP60488.1 sugar ABC transporter ATP-binding protein [Arthrobacter sp. KFRI-F3372]MDR6791632.1 putative multiple sugar transport system ATP-binding protein [Pseudarthrobacter oxydans]MDR7162718.1 putative multiple sugar transport system ATP-binding p
MTSQTTQTEPIILEMRSITKEFPGVKALDNVSLRVKAAEIHAICGENGAGKSTLMKVLSGVYPYGSYDGDIVYQGQVQQFKDIRASEHAGIVIIHQELALIPELSIMENIFLGNEPTKRGVINWAEARLRSLDLLARVGLREDPDTPIKEIGVGKQQLVEIAKALNKSVKILILDEPTAALNESDSQHLLDLMLGLKAKGITSIIISHKLNEIEQIADSITIIRDGKSIETLNVKADGVDEDRIIKGMVGRTLESRFPEHTPKIGEVFFEVKDWTVGHPNVADRLVCKNSSFFVRRGEIVGFAGLMGAGRTELARSVFGRSYGRFISGHIYKDGKEITLKTVRQAIDAGLGYVTEDRKSLGLNLLDDIKTTTVAANLRKISHNSVVDLNQEFTVAEQYRKSLRTKTPSVEEGVAKLSGGNQQKVVLAKWMFTDPDLLILDEPTRGIDVGAKYEIYGIIQQLANQGKGVIVISSELPELLGLSDRIYTIFEGAITGVLNKDEASQESLMKLMTSARKAEAA